MALGLRTRAWTLAMRVQPLPLYGPEKANKLVA